ncbi:MAG: ABC transporter ATP-binding protein [Opitutae bacterium]|nr:ABC transporter ATP-binding protein [Opitutae bacterium]
MSSLLKLWKILNTSQKTQGLILLIITLIGSIVEALGIGLVIPFITLILSTDFVFPSAIAESCPAITFLTKEELVIYMVLIFVTFYLFKSIYILWLTTRQTGFIYSLQESISGRIFSSYLAKPYEFHLAENSSKLISNTITECTQFCVGFVSSVILILNDIFILTAIVSVLLFFEPFGALISLIMFGVIGSLLFIFSKKRAAIWGEARQEMERQRIKSAQHGFSGIKDIKLFNNAKVFVDEYINHTHVSLDAGRKQSILQCIPRIFLEFVAVFALCGIVVFLILDGEQSKVVPIVGLFAAAAFKLLPTISRLVQNFQTVVFCSPSVNLIHSQLGQSRIPTDQTHEVYSDSIKLEKNLNVSNLSFSYDEDNRTALDSINLDFDAGQMIGFIGASGAGKSTLIDCILGLIEPSSGSLSIDGKEITNKNVKAWQKNVGYVPQVIYLLDASLRENIAFGASSDSIDEKKLRSAIDKAQLSDFISDLPKGLDTFVGERGVRLSGGQRQRIGMARALYNNPSVLVLDEATSALDNETESEVMNAVESLQGSRTILIIAHRFSTIKNCNYIYKLENGRVVLEGNPTEVLGKKLLADE